jgi:dGTPase
MKPTRALLDGVLKYKKARSKARWKKHFVYKEQKEFIEFVQTRGSEVLSVECQIMDWADDVAYSVGDLVDGVRARFITTERIKKWDSEKRYNPLIKELLNSLDKRELTHFAARKIGEFIESCDLQPSTEHRVLAKQTNRYRYKLKPSEAKRAEQECLKQISADLVFASPAVQQLEFKAQRMVEKLFTILSKNYFRVGSNAPHLLNEEVEGMFGKETSVAGRARILCDHISGMSDDYFVRTYRRLVEPEFGSIVDLV